MYVHLPRLYACFASYVCMYEHLSTFYACCVCMYVHLSASCMHASHRMYACMYTCLHHTCMYVCMCICLYTSSTYAHTCIYVLEQSTPFNTWLPLSDHKRTLPSLSGLLSGHAPKTAFVHVQRIPVSDIPTDYDQCQEWLYSLFAQKEKLLETMQREGAFPGDPAFSIAFPRTRAYAALLLLLTLIGVFLVALSTFCPPVCLRVVGYGSLVGFVLFWLIQAWVHTG